LFETPTSIYEKEGGLKIAQANLAELQVLSTYITRFYSFNSRVAYSDRITGVAPNTANPTSVVGFVEGTNQNVLSPNFTVLETSAIFTILIQGVWGSIAVQFSMVSPHDRSKKLRKSKISLEQQSLDLQRNVYTAY
jgi:outer membrane protein